VKYRGHQTRIIELGLMKYETVILPLEEQDSPAHPGKIIPFPGIEFADGETTRFPGNFQTTIDDFLKDIGYIQNQPIFHSSTAQPN
jgi:hypothetical protein